MVRLGIQVAPPAKNVSATIAKHCNALNALGSLEWDELSCRLGFTIKQFDQFLVQGFGSLWSGYLNGYNNLASAGRVRQVQVAGFIL